MLGLCGAAFGWSLSKISWLESVRGGLAGWILLGFGAAYCAWGLVRARQNRSHKHFDLHADGGLYVYEHQHGAALTRQERHRVTPWVMFLIFLLGPCEPMIPLLYFPAAKNSWSGMTVLVVVYTVCTLATMTLMVTCGFYGFAFLKTQKLERYMHAIGGLTVFLCGAGMVCMGW